MGYRKYSSDIAADGSAVAVDSSAVAVGSSDIAVDGSAVAVDSSEVAVDGSEVAVDSSAVAVDSSGVAMNHFTVKHCIKEKQQPVLGSVKVECGNKLGMIFLGYYGCFRSGFGTGYPKSACIGGWLTQKQILRSFSHPEPGQLCRFLHRTSRYCG
jgi:hypothetical protein